jgi:hypothetical protein
MDFHFYPKRKMPHKMNIANQTSKDEFMTFFRDEESINTLGPVDRVEVFSIILLGNSDFKK